MCISSKDREVLRRLVHDYAKASDSKRNKNNISDWKRLNSLNPSRPMVMIDQLPWHEMNIDSELDLLCEDEFLRSIECNYRRELYRWRHLDTDQTLSDYIEFNKVVNNTGFGIEVKENITFIDKKNDVHSHEYLDQLDSEEQLKRIKMPHLSYDNDETIRLQSLLDKLVGDIMPVRAIGFQPVFRVWDIIATLRSVTAIYIDLIERPDFIHAIMDRFLKIELSVLQQMENQNLLNPHSHLIHCSGTHTNELPADGFDIKSVRANDCWGCGMAQLFSSCSTEMHDEFEIYYASKYYNHVGLVYYGCCEPLHDKIHIIRKIPNVRKISISPWADINKAADKIGKDFVISKKNNPAFLVTDTLDETLIRNEIRDTLKACEKSGSPCEFILKDISTLKYRPQNLFRWSKIMKEELEY